MVTLPRVPPPGVGGLTDFALMVVAMASAICGGKEQGRGGEGRGGEGRGGAGEGRGGKGYGKGRREGQLVNDSAMIST